VDYSEHVGDSGCWDWECLEEAPNLSLEQYDGLVANYDGCVHHVDRYVGALLDGLYTMGALERAHIVFCTDHGEQFFDHQGWGHGKSIYEELTACPLAYRPPGGLTVSETVGRPVSLIDMMLTVCLRAGMCAPPLHQGMEIKELAGNGEQGRERPVISEIIPRLYSMRLRNWKLICRGSPEEPAWRLFDRTTDPAEQVDLAAVHPDTLEYLKSYFEGLQRQHAQASLQDVEFRLDPETLRQLRDLGYIK